MQEEISCELIKDEEIWKMFFSFLRAQKLKLGLWKTSTNCYCNFKKFTQDVQWLLIEQET